MRQIRGGGFAKLVLTAVLLVTFFTKSYAQFNPRQLDTVEQQIAYLEQIRNETLETNLTFSSSNDPQNLSARMLNLEIRLTEVINSISIEKTDEQSTKNSKDILLSEAIQVYQTIRTYNERIFFHLLKSLDSAFPENGGVQIISMSSDKITYNSNYRKNVAPTEAEAENLYKQQVQKAVQKGIDLEGKFDINLTEIKKINKSVIWLEYVWLENDRIVVTEGKMGHILLAEGRAVKSAGQIMIVKSKDDKINLISLTNASGSYRPDFYTLSDLSKHLAKRLNVKSSKIVLSRGEPLSLQNLNLYKKIYTNSHILRDFFSNQTADELILRYNEAVVFYEDFFRKMNSSKKAGLLVCKNLF
jgi:hypothetical protein